MDNKSISWVRWENLCKPLEEDGLGMKDIRKFNGDLLAKWKWHLVSEQQGKWKDTVVSKYGSKSG